MNNIRPTENDNLQIAILNQAYNFMRTKCLANNETVHYIKFIQFSFFSDALTNLNKWPISLHELMR